MDTIYRVNEIFTDEETFEVIAKCVDLIYDEEFEKYLGEPDDYLAKENASNLLKDSNFEIPEDVRADIEDIFGVAEFDAENDYESGYQFYDEFDDDIDNFDDEFDAYYDGYTEEDEDETSAYNRLKANASESFNLREALNRIDLNTYNKYDLLNLYESCDLSENEKRALANIVYDQDDPRVIYDTLNDRFVGGKEIEMPERVKDGVIHEDTEEEYDFAGLNRELRRELPADEIDNYNMDLYVKVSPKSKEILKKYGIHNHPLLSTFIDQITHTRWYDLPFAYVPINNTEVTEGYEFLDGTKVEAYSDYEIAEERAEELGLKMAEYGDYYNSDLSYCYWNKSGNRNDDAQVIVYYKFENGRPRPLTEMERETVMDKYGIDSFDNPALEDDMGTYFDDIQPELEEGFTQIIDWDRVIIDVSNLLDDKELGDKWIEVFTVSTSPTYVRLEITGDDDITRPASFTAKGNRVEVAFKNGSEAVCNSPEEIARFIAGEYGLSLDNNTNEDWSHFTYKSGANPYIATNDKEANKLVKKYGSKCKKVKDDSDGTSYYEIDDLNESSSKNDYTAEFTPRGSSGTQICKKDSVDNLIGELIKRGYSISGVLKERIIEWDKSGKKKFYGPCLTIIKGEAEMTDYTSF